MALDNWIYPVTLVKNLCRIRLVRTSVTDSSNNQFRDVRIVLSITDTVRYNVESMATL